ncbi:MAG: DUF4177 domain-containing protein [Oscillospiraceae bacterium]|jgi:hypothetical protein|nr:DUF4177 domain-containing protein [Oscillospiraceae bacterium]
MRKWEYKVFTLPVHISMRKMIDEHEALLNELGAEGWELVAVNGQSRFAYFKREII